MAEPWFKKYVASYVKTPGQYDAGNYGVRVELVEGAINRCIGVHHLDQSENNGNHNVYVCLVDKDGKRIPGAKFEWTRVGLNKPFLVACDKPENEADGNFALDSIDVLASVWIHGALSDRVTNLSTKHLDEPPGNRLGHHSYLVVFQRGADVPTPPPPPPTPPLGNVEAALRHIEVAAVEIEGARKALKQT